MRERLVRDAAGNPLALVELPEVLSAQARGGRARVPAEIPLSTRLERAFVARVSELPEQTQLVISVAAFDDGDALDEILAAAQILGADEAEEALGPAVDAQLVSVMDATLRFRNPMIRSAIRQATGLAERHSVHAALSTVLSASPHRQVWHRAAATVGKDEAVAADLVAAAERAQQLGAISEAVAALERAAALSVGDHLRNARLIRAAQLAHEMGSAETVITFLHQAPSLQLTPLEEARVLWLADYRYESHRLDAPDQIGALIRAAHQASDDDDANLACQLLDRAAYRCWAFDPDAELRRDLVACAERLAVAPDDPRLLQILAWADPIGQGASVIARLPAATAETSSDGSTLDRIGTTARRWALSIAQTTSLWLLQAGTARRVGWGCAFAFSSAKPGGRFCCAIGAWQHQQSKRPLGSHLRRGSRWDGQPPAQRAR